jgi:hypothetical protein
MIMAERDPIERYDTTEDTPPTPRWVKVFGIIALVVILLVGIILIAGVGGEHGPGRHGGGGNTPSIEQGMQQP